MRAPTSPDSLLRFDLAVQRNHLFVYFAALVTSLIGRALGVFPLNIPAALAAWVSASVVSTLFYFLYKRGVRRTILNPLWMATDMLLVTTGVVSTGGIISPWFIWYVTTAAAASFAAGKIAAYVVSAGNTIAYVAALFFIGQATWGNDVFLLAITRMIFVFGASYFFLVGVANLQEKRLRIRMLESDESRKVAELTRLADELADANRRIQDADRLKSRFLANMSHELRTPMNSIIGFSEILAERLEGKVDEKHLGFIHHILTSGQHLLSIINDILDLSKIEAGKMEINPEVFSLPPVVESVCQMMRGMAKHEPQFVIDVPQDLPPLETDLAKFKQVLFNLLSNAVKFSAPQSPIVITARCDDERVTVSVRDEGIGIDPEQHQAIFQEFRQVDATTRREFGGTGLGLALVKKFLELQGGTVAVESALGKGSTFSFTLPLRAQAAAIGRELVPHGRETIALRKES